MVIRCEQCGARFRANPEVMHTAEAATGSMGHTPGERAPLAPDLALAPALKAEANRPPSDAAVDVQEQQTASGITPRALPPGVVADPGSQLLPSGSPAPAMPEGAPQGRDLPARDLPGDVLPTELDSQPAPRVWTGIALVGAGVVLSATTWLGIHRAITQELAAVSVLAGLIAGLTATAGGRRGATAALFAGLTGAVGILAGRMTLRLLPVHGMGDPMTPLAEAWEETMASMQALDWIMLGIGSLGAALMACRRPRRPSPAG